MLGCNGIRWDERVELGVGEGGVGEGGVGAGAEVGESGGGYMYHLVVDCVLPLLDWEAEGCDDGRGV